MAKVAVKHPGFNSEEATEPPKREPPPEGKYAAIIMAATPSVATWTDPPLSIVSVEFQLTHRFKSPEEGSGIDQTENGRRVWQKYILEHEDSRPDLSQLRRFELRQLIDAANVELDDDGAFDTDHLVQKSVHITVAHRTGKDKDPITNEFPRYANVVRVESSEKVDESELV